MRERFIERTVVNKAEAAGWFTRKLAWVGRTGAPDRFFARGGRLVFIEFKRPGEAPRADQDREIRELLAAGAEVHVCDTIANGLAILGLE